MTNVDQSPTAAELYFERSIFGQLYMIFADALRRDEAGSHQRAGENRSSTGRASRDGAAQREGKSRSRPSLLDRLEAWQWRQHQKDREAYLAAAEDVFDLERRLAAIDRDIPSRYY